MSDSRSLTKAYFALAAVCLIWGTTYLVNKLGVNSMPPLFFIAVRQSIAGVVLLFYSFLILREKFPGLDFFKIQIPLALLMISIGNGVGILGLQYIDSGISSIIASLSPLIIAFLYSVFKVDAKVDKITWLGLVLGTIGIVLICIDKLSSSEQEIAMKGFLFTFCSVMAWSAGAVYGKLKATQHNLLMASGFQLLLGSIPIWWGTFTLEKPFDHRYTLAHYGIWAYTIIFGSLIAYTCYLYCINKLPITLVSIHTYINPLLAILLGWLILNEHININILLGAVITLMGVYLVTNSQKKARKKSVEI